MMHLPVLALLCTTIFTPLCTATITYHLSRAPSPTADQADAYARIEKAMALAAARYNRLSPLANKSITASYVPTVQTADGNFNGNIRFGSDRAYMTERTALHETAHTLGVGQTAAFDRRCAAAPGAVEGWPSATRLVRSWDGEGARMNCGGGHFWPYGLNYESEFNVDGLAG